MRTLGFVLIAVSLTGCNSALGIDEPDVEMAPPPGGLLAPYVGNVDGDVFADLVLWSSNGHWYIDQQVDGFGGWNQAVRAPAGPAPASAVSVPGLYDDDELTDLALWSQDGLWRIDLASNGFGSWDETRRMPALPDARPVPANYDGDAGGRVELAVWSEGTWYIHTGATDDTGWDLPVVGVDGVASHLAPADYDRDGTTDLSMLSVDGVWRIDLAANGFGSWDREPTGYGLGDLVPVPADYDGDGQADLSIKTGTGYWLRDNSTSPNPGWEGTVHETGDATAVPAPADYDGDGCAEIAVVTDREWHIESTRDGLDDNMPIAWDHTIKF